MHEQPSWNEGLKEPLPDLVEHDQPCQQPQNKEQEGGLQQPAGSLSSKGELATETQLNQESLNRTGYLEEVSGETKELEIGYKSSHRFLFLTWSFFAALPLCAAVYAFGLAKSYAQMSVGEFTAETLQTQQQFFLWFTVVMFAVSILFFSRALWHKYSKRPPVWLKISDDEITFSRIWSIETLNRLSRPWSDVHAVSMTGFAGTRFLSKIKWDSINYFSATPQLRIIFRTGGSAHVKLPLLSRPQAAALLDALSQRVGGRALSADVVKLKEALLMENDNLSYTELWQQDLEMRHGSTHFAPLRAATSLQDGRYKILAELATGGLSAVYLAEDRNGQRIVLKESVLPLDMADAARQKAREMFRREAALLMKVKCPQVARVLDQFVEDERDYIVTEFIPGRTLRQLVAKEGRQKEEEVIAWTREVASILRHLHNLSPPVVHRDVTPDNLVLREDGTIVLIDFGAANEYLGAATGTMVGKQAYIAPEQLRGKSQPASDLYSLGASMYFLLTGKDPLPLSQSEPKSLVPSISDATDSLVRALTEMESEDRLPSAALLVERLQSKQLNNASLPDDTGAPGNTGSSANRENKVDTTKTAVK